MEKENSIRQTQDLGESLIKLVKQEREVEATREGKLFLVDK